MIETALKAIIGITVILSGWLLVQTAWRQVFPGTPADEDILAGRLGCHGCSRQDSCEKTNCDADETALHKPSQSEG